MIGRDGTNVEGKVSSIQADSLTLRTPKSSDVQAYPKRETSIPRASVLTTQLLEMKFIERVAGTVIGLATAAAIALSKGIFEKESGGQIAGEAAAQMGFPWQDTLSEDRWIEGSL